VAAAITTILGTLTLFVLLGPLTGGWVVMLLRAREREGGKIELGDLFGGFERFLPLAGLFFLTLIPLLVGFALLLVPGLLLLTLWTFSYPLVIDKGHGVLQSLGASAAIARQKGFWPLVLLNCVLVALPLFAIGVPIIGFAIDWLVLPFTSAAWVSAYVQAVREDGGDLAGVQAPRPGTT
jgi:hypothetical protein